MTGNLKAAESILMVGWDTDVGGAASATRNIYKALKDYSHARDFNFEFRLRTIKGSKPIDNGHEIGVASVGRFSYIVQKYRWFLRRGLRHVLFHEPSFLLTTADIDTGMGREIIRRKPDLVHLFWLGNRTISVKEIGRIQKAGIPIVWTMSDCWPVSGIYHYPPLGEKQGQPGFRGREATGESRKARLWDRRVFRAKMKHWSQPISLVVKSSWLKDRVDSSSLSRDWPVILIPNPVNSPSLQTVQASGAGRAKIKGAVILGFGFLGKAAERKGAQIVEIALSQISDMVKKFETDIALEVILFGDATLPPSLGEGHRITVRTQGRVPRDRMPELYASLDILLAPSLQDNSPNVVSEAVAQGIPVIAFAGTGLDDVVIDGVTGLTAQEGDIPAFSKAVARLVLDAKLRSELSESCSTFAVRNWAPEVVAEKYIDLYRSILAKDS